MSRKELSKELLSEIENNLSVGKRSAMYFKDENAHRRDATKDIASVVRPPFVRDAGKGIEVKGVTQQHAVAKSHFAV